MILQMRHSNTQKEKLSVKDKTLLREILFYIFALITLAILVFPEYPFKVDDNQIVGINIKGEVNAPGYYELEYGSRVKDAILAAGGEKNSADLTMINLAMQLIDGEEIEIPSKLQTEEKVTVVVNINTADMYKLCKLDGIGESIAYDIVQYRAENGPFKTIDDLKNVKGIGKQKFDKIKNQITVG